MTFGTESPRASELRSARPGVGSQRTFKRQKCDYRNEGYDPSNVKDPLYYLDGRQYVPIDDEVYGRLTAGEIGPR